METLVKSSSLLPSMNTFVEDFFSKDLFDWNTRNFSGLGSTLPSANLKETDTKMEIDLAVPGMKKEDFKIQLENDILSVSCEKKEEKEENNMDEKYTRREFSYQSFYRSFHLPNYVKQDEIKAEYKDGLLQIVISKDKSNGANKGKIIQIK